MTEERRDVGETRWEVCPLVSPGKYCVCVGDGGGDLVHDLLNSFRDGTSPGTV